MNRKQTEQYNAGHEDAVTGKVYDTRKGPHYLAGYLDAVPVRQADDFSPAYALATDSQEIEAALEYVACKKQMGIYAPFDADEINVIFTLENGGEFEEIWGASTSRPYTLETAWFSPLPIGIHGWYSTQEGQNE